MVTLVICLIGAGALLSFLTRVTGLALILVGFSVILVSLAGFALISGDGGELLVRLIASMIALQAGYGLTIVLRSILVRPAQKSKDQNVQSDPSKALPQLWSKSHDG